MADGRLSADGRCTWRGVRNGKEKRALGDKDKLDCCREDRRRRRLVRSPVCRCVRRVDNSNKTPLNVKNAIGKRRVVNRPIFVQGGMRYSCEVVGGVVQQHSSKAFDETLQEFHCSAQVDWNRIKSRWLRHSPLADRPTAK